MLDEGASRPFIKRHALDAGINFFDAVEAASLKLDEAELKALREHYGPHRVLGHA